MGLQVGPDIYGYGHKKKGINLQGSSGFPLRRFIRLLISNFVELIELCIN